jgi:excisionase family DNA binding protein
MRKEILTIDEAAELLQLSKRSVYKLVRQGGIPAKKVLNKWRFERQSLKRWLSGGKGE